MTDVNDLAASPPSAPPPPWRRTEALTFTASGSEYFRIWLVNLLLTILTLSLYLPFAKARRLTYFYSNTRIGGHALSFHGNPWKMLRGYLLVAALGGLYALASRLAPAVAAAAALLFGALWPALWRASLQFRLANTRWRGVPMRFHGSLAGAYAAQAPVLVPLMILIATGLAADDAEGAKPPMALVAAAIGALLALPLLWPLGTALTRRYQHEGYGYAGERCRFQAGVGAFYLLNLKVGLLSLLSLLAGGALVFVLLGLGLFNPRDAAVRAMLVIASITAGYGALFIVVLPLWTARLQNLVWNATASPRVHFHSQLAFAPMARLTLTNLVLMILTLGLYRPFAAVNTARLRLQAVSLTLLDDPDGWVAGAAAANPDATGDAAGDFFGIDLGL